MVHPRDGQLREDQFKTCGRKNTASDDNGETLERFAERRDDGVDFGALERALALGSFLLLVKLLHCFLC